MSKFLLFSICLLLAGCQSGITRFAETEKECQKDPSLITSEMKQICYYDKGRPVIAKYYPLALDTYDAYAKQAISLAQKVDKKEITKVEYGEQIKPYDNKVKYVIQNYNAVAMDIAKQRYCTQLGAPPGSDKYYDCRKSIEQELAAEQAQQAQQAQQQLILQQIQQQQIYQGQQNMIRSFQPSPSFNCTSTQYIPGMVNTHCN